MRLALIVLVSGFVTLGSSAAPPSAPTRAPGSSGVSVQRTALLELRVELFRRLRALELRRSDAVIEAQLAELRDRLSWLAERLDALEFGQPYGVERVPRYAPQPYVQEEIWPRRPIPRDDCPTCPRVPYGVVAPGGAVRYSTCPPLRSSP